MKVAFLGAVLTGSLLFANQGGAETKEEVADAVRNSGVYCTPKRIGLYKDRSDYREYRVQCKPGTKLTWVEVTCKGPKTRSVCRMTSF